MSTVQPRIGTTPERSRSRDCPRQRYGKSGVDSRTAATVNRTTASKSVWTAFDAVESRQLPERVARSVVETTVSLPTQSTRWQCRRSLMKSINEEMPYFTGFTVTRSPAWNARRTRVATESRSRQKRHVSYENTAATAVVQCHVQADGLSLRGRPTPSPQESVEEGCGQTHYFDGKTTTTPYTSDSNHVHNHANRARKSWSSDVSIILPGWRRHTGGSRSIPTVHPYGLRSRGCG